MNVILYRSKHVHLFGMETNVLLKNLVDIMVTDALTL